MNRSTTLTVVCLAAGGILAAQSKTPRTDLVDFEMMTWVEVKYALEHGKTTALIYNGGTEQRGPQNVNGGHTLMGHATVVAIAQKLGNAIAAPVLPFSPNNANPNLPGTIGITAPLFAEINEQVAEQMIKNGFKNVVLMGDHGGGQKELRDVAKKLDEKYGPTGIHVFYCDEVYKKANDDFDKWAVEQGYPPGGHAYINDTSEMIYLGGDKGWTRAEEMANAVGDPPRQPGAARDQNAQRVNNGIQGDARRSSAELGKKVFDIHVDYAVAQINRMIPRSK
jgi:creatinine amidohydrolase